MGFKEDPKASKAAQQKHRQNVQKKTLVQSHGQNAQIQPKLPSLLTQFGQTSGPMLPSEAHHLQRTIGNRGLGQLIKVAAQKSSQSVDSNIQKRPSPLISLQRMVKAHEMTTRLESTVTSSENGLVQACRGGGCDCCSSKKESEDDLHIQRQVDWQNGQKNHNKNLAVNYANMDFSNGFTPPTLNGSEILSTDAASVAINGPTLSVTPASRGRFTAKVTDVPTNTVSFNMYLPTAGPWSTQADKGTIGAILGGDAESCQGEDGQTTFSVTGIPDHTALAAQVETHEEYHARDHRRLTNNILASWDRKLWWAKNLGFSYTAADPEAAVAKLYRKMGGTPDEIATRLSQAWDTASDDYHKKTAGKTNIRDAGANDDCSTSYVTVTVP